MRKIFKKMVKIITIIVVVIIALCLAAVLYLQHPKFGGKIKEGSERALRIEKSLHYKEGYFSNLEPNPAPKKKESAIGRLMNFYDLLFVRSKTTHPKVTIPAIKTDLSAIDPQEEVVVWLGHSSYYIQIGGKRIVMDPVFGGAAPLPSLIQPFEGTDIYSVDDIPAVDYIFITHDHWDHLEYPTIKELIGRTQHFVCPLGVGAHLERWGVAPENIVELDWDESAMLEQEFEITALPARHYSGRLLEKNKMLWCGYMLNVKGYHFYISGDTGYGIHIPEIANRFPTIDFAIMENGQYDMDWRHIHFVPEDLVLALHTLQPKSFITSHNSKYALARHVWENPLQTVYEAAQQDSTIHLLYPKIGEIVPFKEDNWQGEVWWE